MAERDLSLVFHVLNVGHGSSIVVEHNQESGKAFGVIDSNHSGTGAVKALEVLRQLGAKRLSFLSITHPHADHYTGIYQIIQEFDRKIGSFFSFPMGDVLSDRKKLAKWAKALAAVKERGDDQRIRSAAQEMMRILKWADTNKDIWICCDGHELKLAPEDFHQVDIHTILPPRRAKGNYLQIIEKQDPTAFCTVKDNEISLAFRFRYRGITVILGGDGTESNWEYRRINFERNLKDPIGARAVNLPHHGSKLDFSEDTMRQLFAIRPDEESVGITSANGHSHPDIEVLEILEKRGIKPYCTNLHTSCGANVSRLEPLPDLDPELSRWLREVSDSSAHIQPCQGDIRVEIDDSGALAVTPQFARLCGYRGDYDNLF